MLKQRVVSAIIALALLLAVLFVAPPVLAHAVIALVIAAAAWEWSQFLGADSQVERVAFVAVIVLGELGVTFAPVPGLQQLVLYVALVGWIAALVWTTRFPTPIPKLLVWVGGILALLPTFIALTVLYSRSAWWLLGLLVIVWLADIGAYFSGRRFGQRKLAPAISPGKTWEGVAGGLLAALVAVVAAIPFVGLEPLPALALGVVVILISVVGDLTVSMFKRTSGIKDSGRLFPGHGGLLDRIDSVCAAAPVFTLGVAVLGL